MIDKVQKIMSGFDYAAVTPRRVEAALKREHRDCNDLGALLSPAAAVYLEDMAVLARDVSLRFFGRNVSLYTPLYIANYCVNRCLYCGYNHDNHIRRARLSPAEIAAEAAAIAATGLKDILLLTGESRIYSSPAYIGQAVEILNRYFPSVGLEIYPLRLEQYGRLHELGSDFISVYQETYDPALYDRVHLSGPKKNYSWRFGANERALAAGFRGASFGVLLGLGDFRRDVLACAAHALLVQEKYPQAEIGFSVPRIRPYPNREKNETGIGEAQLLQIILSLRLFMPWAGISLSTRESAHFRDNCIGLGITRLSAGVSTGVGGHLGGEKGDQQFHKADPRSAPEICRALVSRGYQPVFRDYIRV
ncbi:MAG: 2-iminoacetate synthase ThiH [Desulfarculales bacterium]|jgi:2-iminoacetate synthase|nr:2-iminoacetate synthase ThiH [Desulfarculales bacterium]